PPTPRFASEDEDDAQFVIPAPRHAEPEVPVLVPVSSRDLVSAFREPEPEPAMAIEEVPEEDEPVTVAVADNGAQYNGAQEEIPVMAHAAFEDEPGENLDIPAFMRKGTL
ncbi:MAG: hypothetical protein WA399_01075, partial [Acidobacteriaceae bacterium]